MTEGFFFNLDSLYGRPRDNKIAIFDQKYLYIKFLDLNFLPFLFIETMNPDPHPNPHPDSDPTRL
jgi:hypothetical protein